jgi:hypothetical protein
MAIFNSKLLVYQRVSCLSWVGDGPYGDVVRFLTPPRCPFCGRNFMGSRWLENTVFRGHEISLVMYQEPLRNKLVPFHNSWMVNIIGGTIPCLFHKLLVLSWNKNGISILWWVNMIGNYWNIILVGGWALPLWKMWVSQFRLLFHGSKPPTRWWGRHDLPGLIYIYGLGYNIVFNFQRDVKHNRTGRNAWPLTQGIPRESDRTNINFGLNDGLNMLKTLRFDLPQQT